MPAHRLRILSTAGLVLALGLATLALWGHAVDAPLDRDEGMYVGAGVLARSRALYAETPFLQMPVLPWIYAAFLPSPGEGPLLLRARLFTVACAGFVLVALVGICRRRGISPWIGLAFALLLSVQPTFVASAREATNHLPPLAAFAGAVWLLARMAPSRRACVGAGVLLGLAVGLRATWAPVALAIWIAIALVTRERRAVGLVALGASLVALPILVVASAAPDAFVFQNLTFHGVNRAWAIESGRPWDLGRSAFFRALDDLVIRQSAHGWLLALVTAGVLAIRRPRHVVAGLLVAAALVLSSALPSPWWARHALPFVGGTTVVAVAIFPKAVPAPRWIAGILVVATLLGVTPRGDRHAAAIGAAFTPDDGFAQTFYEECRMLAGMTDEAVATLSPLFVLEAGLALDPPSVAGPFVWRVREELSPEQRERTAGAHATLDPRRAPAAILCGAEPQFETDVVARLRAAGYAPLAAGPAGTTLWGPVTK